MWIDKEFYTSHIKDYEKLVKMRRVLDKIEIVINNQVIESTDFLDPYEIYLAQSILNRFEDISFKIWGGYEGAERRIALIYPNYYDKADIISEISSLKINNSMESLSHKDYLGAILNLGIIREKIGDILVFQDHSYVLVKKEISSFIAYNLSKVGNKRVEVIEVNQDNIEIPESEFKETTCFVSSLRLDSILSASLNLSRKASLNLIKSNEVKVNWEPIERASKEVEEGDLISVRKYGRILIYKVAGLSKSGRRRCIIRILI